MKNTISNYDDVIDSRDIIERIEELESMIEDNNELSEDEQEELDNEIEELKILQELAKDGEDYSEDWKYGVQLIRDSYFTEYAQELAEDTGMMEKEVRWPYTCIDWEWAARELKYDYTSIDFNGITYWVRQEINMTKTTKRYCYWLPPELMEVVRRVAEDNRRPMVQQLILILETWAEHVQGKEEV